MTPTRGEFIPRGYWENDRMERREKLIDNLLKQQGVEITSDLSIEIQELAKKPDNKIEAIKRYRDQTGVGLAEAKDTNEAFIREVRR